MTILGKSDSLHDSIRKIMHTTVEALRQYDMKLRSKVNPSVKDELALELSKDKLMDIGTLVMMAMQISTSDESKDYEHFMWMITTFLDKLLFLQGKRKPVNMKKYKALLNLLTEEVKADAEGGTAMFDFCEETGEVTMQMVHPNTLVDAKPTV